MFALLKVDKILASTLPIGKYPLLSVDKLTVIVILSWILSFGVSIIVNTLYPCSYEPAVVLCIPVLPIGFFITVFSVFCVIFVFIIIGFLSSIVYLKKAGLNELELSFIQFFQIQKTHCFLFQIQTSSSVKFIGHCRSKLKYTTWSWPCPRLTTKHWKKM